MVAVPDRARGSARNRRRRPRPGRLGLDRVADANAARDRLVHVAEDAARDARRAARRRRRSPPRPRSARAAGRAPRRRSAARARCARRRPRRAPQLGPRRRARAAARASRAGRRRRPRARARDERAAVVAERRPVKAPRASGSACGVRSPARYGRKVRPSAPGCQRRRLGEQLVVARRGASRSRSQRSEPAAESITPIACQRAGTAWQKTCTRACGSARVPGQRGEDDAGGAEHDRQRARGGRCRRRARRRPGRRRRADLACRLGRRRQPFPRQLERVAAPRRSSAGRATSKSSVPEASATSIARSPVRRRRT